MPIRDDASVAQQVVEEGRGRVRRAARRVTAARRRRAGGGRVGRGRRGLGGRRGLRRGGRLGGVLLRVAAAGEQRGGQADRLRGGGLLLLLLRALLLVLAVLGGLVERRRVDAAAHDRVLAGQVRAALAAGDLAVDGVDRELLLARRAGLRAARARVLEERVAAGDGRGGVGRARRGDEDGAQVVADRVVAVGAGALVEDEVQQALDAAGVQEVLQQAGEVLRQRLRVGGERAQVADQRPGLD